MTTLDDIKGKALITVMETAEVTGLGRTATYDAIRRGDIPHRRVGRRVLVPVPALLTWLGASA